MFFSIINIDIKPHKKYIIFIKTRKNKGGLMWVNKPTKFGVLHIVMIIITIIVFALASYLGYRFQDKKYERKRALFLTIAGFSFFLGDVIKTIFSSIVGVADLTLIPFQICSTPMYILPLMYFVKNEKVKKTCVSYLSFIGLTAAIAYFVNPTAMLKPDYIFLSLYSVIYHTVMVGITAFTFVSYEASKKENLKYYPDSFLIFIGFSLIAVACNYIAHAVNENTVINFFYLHPSSPATFPIIDTLIKPHVPFVVYYLIFLVCYFAISFVPYALFFVIELVRNKIRGQKNE